MHVLLSLRYVAAGGVVGALLRWGLLELGGPTRTNAVVIGLNAVGALVLGALVGRKLSRGRPRMTENQFLLAGTGFCGALTTFSTYAVEVAAALQEGSLSQAAAIGFTTPLLAVLCAGAGYRIGTHR